MQKRHRLALTTISLVTLCTLCLECSSEQPASTSVGAEGDETATGEWVPIREASELESEYEDMEPLEPVALAVHYEQIDTQSVTPLQLWPFTYFDYRTAIFCDIDNDSVTDVIFNRTKMAEPRSTGDLTLTRYDADTGALLVVDDLPEWLSRYRTVYSCEDVDGDGFNDLIGSSIDHDQTLYGSASGEFVEGEVLYEKFVGGDDPNVGGINIALSDLDLDGWLDLAVGLDSDCRTGMNRDFAPFYRVAPRTLEGRLDLVEPHPIGHLYGLTVFPRPDGQPIVHRFGDDCDDVEGALPSHGFYQIKALDETGTPIFESFDPTQFDSDFKFSDGAIPGAFLPSKQPMGALSDDLNGDGFLDLVSATSSPRLLVFQGGSEWPFVERTQKADLKNPAIADPITHDYHLPWGVAGIDLDLDGQGDLVVTHGDDFESADRESIPPQFITAHINRGNWRFTDASQKIGLEEPAESNGIAIGDLNRDGYPDIIVQTLGEFPRIFVSTRVDPNLHGLAVELAGSTSNPPGIGALVQVEVADDFPVRTQLMGGIGGFKGNSKAILFFGLGPHETAALVRVNWPSGVVQEVPDVPASQILRIEEPPFITLSEKNRELPADGQSEVEIWVTPRHPDGSLRTGGTVTIEVSHGPADFVTPVEASEDGFRRRLRAPRTPGSSRIVVTVDGKQAGIAPRMWWR